MILVLCGGIVLKNIVNIYKELNTMDLESIKKAYNLLKTYQIEEVGMKINESIESVPIFLLPFQVRCYECYFTLISNNQPFLEKLEKHEHEEFELVLK